MRVLGVDFGTSNTVAMVRGPDGRARPLLFDGSPLQPSCVYLDADGRMLVGRDAERSARIDPSRYEPNPKRRVDDGVVLLGDQELPLPQVVAAVLRRIATEAQRQLGGPCDELRMTHPAQWGERRRAVLVDSARAAGLPAPRLIAEPVAAASYYTAVLGTAVPVGRALGIYDLGGGTFDATVVRRTQAGFEVLAEQGLGELGGLDFDQALVEHLGRGYSTDHTMMWNSVISPADAGQRRQRTLLYDDVRGAKEMLSRTTSADIHLPALDISAHITREEFEALIRPGLMRTVTCLAQTITAARLRPADLVGIFLVGGSSRIPLAAHLIHSELGLPPTTLEQPETVVAEGALCFGAPTGGAGQGHSGVPRAVPARPAPGPPARPGMVRQPVAPPRSGPPYPPQQPARPVSAGPPQPIRPVPAGPPQPPRMVPPPQQPQPARPPVAAPQQHQPHQPRPVPTPRPPVMAPRQPEKSWYEEPAKVWTLALAVMVVIAVVVLLVSTA
ncbi:Hsp70 family protein [Polymorphospora rubra]|uniref:Hsp70 family protein n=1 Tax=Polymorphospora rubra TaxID=338584 RepID=UPI0033E7CB4A